MKQFLLPEAARDALIAYLQERPFKEVAQGIAMLSTLADAKVPDAGERLKAVGDGD